MAGMLDSSIYGIKIKVEMIHHKIKGRFDAKVYCPVCNKSYTYLNSTIWTAAKNNAVNKLRSHYISKHK